MVELVNATSNKIYYGYTFLKALASAVLVLFLILFSSTISAATVCDFSANPTSGTVPLTVTFQDLNTGSHLNWQWSFYPAYPPWNPTHTFDTAGTYTVTLSVSDGNSWASKSVTINVLKATPIINWVTPADIIYGTALSKTQLNAQTINPTTGETVTGSFTYTKDGTPIDIGTTLSAGMGQKLHVDFIPTDITNYNTASKDVTINVLNATTNVPEFPSIVIPVTAILGIIVIYGRKNK